MSRSEEEEHSITLKKVDVRPIAISHLAPQTLPDSINLAEERSPPTRGSPAKRRLEKPTSQMRRQNGSNSHGSDESALWWMEGTRTKPFTQTWFATCSDEESVEAQEKTRADLESCGLTDHRIPGRPEKIIRSKTTIDVACDTGVGDDFCHLESKVKFYAICPHFCDFNASAVKPNRASVT